MSYYCFNTRVLKYIIAIIIMIIMMIIIIIYDKSMTQFINPMKNWRVDLVVWFGLV